MFTTPKLPNSANPKRATPKRATEEEHVGSIWTHPYMVYIVLTVILFFVLVLIGYMGWKNGWIPNQSST